jgi:ammonia channel protein AmtB
MKDSIDLLWICVVISMTIFLVVGRNMVELGAVKAKSTRHIAAKNMC